MGALSGAITTTAYYIVGELPEGFRETFLDALGKNAFQDIDLALDHDESFGWVTIKDPFDTEFDLNKVLWGDYFMVTLRHDVIRLPAAAFKFHLAKAVKDQCVATGKERLSKPEVEDLKERLERDLKKRVLPSIKTVDFVWNIERGQGWLFTQNKGMLERFIDIFEDTFGLQAHERNPYSLVEHMGLGDEALDKLFHIEPAAMAAPPK
ncbi:MAG: hypothetical protein H6745_24160 [Deltaproteobacteria bacterium]|nr:hypothetical protein [Deltaproteobacteria bacterium]